MMEQVLSCNVFQGLKARVFAKAASMLANYVSLVILSDYKITANSQT